MRLKVFVYNRVILQQKGLPRDLNKKKWSLETQVAINSFFMWYYNTAVTYFTLKWSAGSFESCSGQETEDIFYKNALMSIIVSKKSPWHKRIKMLTTNDYCAHLSQKGVLLSFSVYVFIYSQTFDIMQTLGLWIITNVSLLDAM